MSFKFSGGVPPSRGRPGRPGRRASAPSAGRGGAYQAGYAAALEDSRRRAGGGRGKPGGRGRGRSAGQSSDDSPFGRGSLRIGHRF